MKEAPTTATRFFINFGHVNMSTTQCVFFSLFKWTRDEKEVLFLSFSPPGFFIYV